MLTEKELSLFNAASNNQADLVNNLLNHDKVDPNVTDNQGRKPLHIAVEQNHAIAMVNILLEAGARANVADEEGKTPLHHAVKYTCDIDVVASLMRAHADVNATTTQGKTPLMKSIESDDDLPLVRSLVETHRANIHKADHFKETALHKAAAKGCRLIIQYLISQHADINALNDELETPLFNMVAGEWEDLEEELAIEIAKEMINAGAKVNLQNRFGNTLLHLAVMGNKVKMAAALIAAGASTDLRNNEGVTPLELAIEEAEEYDEDPDLDLMVILLNQQQVQVDDEKSPSPVILQEPSEKSQSVADRVLEKSAPAMVTQFNNTDVAANIGRDDSINNSHGVTTLRRSERSQAKKQGLTK